MFDALCRFYTTAEMDFITYDIAAEIYAKTRKAGQRIEDGDIILAALCIANDYILVSDNAKPFEIISQAVYGTYGLMSEDWTV